MSIFTQLSPFSWGPVSFPVSKMSVSLVHDLAEHKYWGQDGAKVEATGRQALAFEATIPFRNNIFPGKGEAWSFSVLYPDAYRAFLAAMAERKTQELGHPELGKIRCKPRSCRTTWDGGRQDGVEVEAAWVETIETDDQPDPIASGSPVSSEVEAGDLDTILTSPDALKALAPDLPAFKPGLADMVRGIAAMGDRLTILQKRANGQIDNLAYQVDTISDSMQGARNALTWPVDRSCMRLGDSLTRLRQEVVASGKSLTFYVVGALTPASALAAQLGVDVGVLMRINPFLARDGLARAGKVVKYFGQKNT